MLKQISKITLFGLIVVLSSCEIAPTSQKKRLSESLSTAISASTSGRLLTLIGSSDDFHSALVDTFEDRRGENRKERISDYQLNRFRNPQPHIVTLQEIKTDVFVLALNNSLNYLNLDLEKLTISTSKGEFKMVNDFSGAGRFEWLFERAGEYVRVQLDSATDDGIDGTMIYYLNN